MSRRPAAGYVLRPVPRHRQVVLDMLTSATRRFPIHGIVELDVGRARECIAAADPPVSWTGFVIATVARAVAPHPEVNARRVGNRVMYFDGVDVGATVERDVLGDHVLTAVTIDDADRKSCARISEELHQAKLGLHQDPARGLTSTVARLPGPLRRRIVRAGARIPRVAATFRPTIGVTSLGMFSHGGGWGIPFAPLTLIVTVSGILDRPVVRDGQVVVRPMMPLTLTFDHAVVDGAPAARFAETLRGLTESAAVFE
jgi:pyruvate/2-oxoglutarate dehydrogenase complex dihydrolipoamide acyltransferase (E2) component